MHNGRDSLKTASTLCLCVLILVPSQFIYFVHFLHCSQLHLSFLHASIHLTASLHLPLQSFPQMLIPIMSVAMNIITQHFTHL